MELVEQETANRLQEIEILLKLIREIERPRSKIRGVAPVAALSVTTLKASSFLLLYNVIESCVRTAFQQTYAEMHNEGVCFEDFPDGIREIWIKQEFSVPTDTANQSTYLKRAREIANSIASKDVPELDPRKLPISGSLDGGSIQRLCSKHGFSIKMGKRARGGAELVTIKEQRNALAHGDKSFAECGREYGVEDLERIYRQTKYFLGSFTKSVSKFNASRGYRV
ncbi:MAE_28990/MAE_18760 family HEPN-like nuclease [Pseudoxanthomonas winnipegensis]|uniref:MAE_28990/MAE_18760 family HEPN-like nuclease n=1 Tax=Pseudoxanthomonas winnipegensis TaxID=2480810 RepID=UPI003F868C6B